MKGVLVRWVISALSLLFVGYVLPGVEVENFFYAMVAAAFLGILNAVIRPVLILLTLPLTIFTLGFFIFVINGLMLWLMSGIIKGIHITGFWSAFAGALILSIVSWLTSSYVSDRGRVEYIDLRHDRHDKWS